MEYVHGLLVASTFENQSRMHECLIGDHGCVFAFVGAAAIGNLTDAFKPLAMAMPLQVVSVLPTESTIKGSHVSMTSMCVGDLAIWLGDGPKFMNSCIYIGWSLGAIFAKAVVLLCEAALGPPRAIVTLDIRKSYPVRVIKDWDRIAEIKTKISRVVWQPPKVVVL